MPRCVIHSRVSAGLLLLLACAGSAATHVELALERGDTALQLGDAEDAADAYREALAGDPHNLRGLHGLARSHVVRGEPEQALVVFYRLSTLDPDLLRGAAATDYHFALYQAAKQSLRRGDSALALKRVRLLRSLDPGHGGLDELEIDSLIAEGGRLQVAGQTGSAEALFREALGRGTPRAERAGSAALARALLERRLTDRAISVLSDALLLHPEDPELQALMDRALEIRYPQ